MQTFLGSNPLVVTRIVYLRGLKKKIMSLIFFFSSQDLLSFFEYKLPAKLKVMKRTKISNIRNFFHKINFSFTNNEKGVWYFANSVRQGMLAV